MIPIFTDTIWTYADIAEQYEHLYCFGDSNKKTILDAALSAKVDANKLEKEYKSVMDEYFNPEKKQGRTKGVLR